MLDDAAATPALPPALVSLAKGFMLSAIPRAVAAKLSTARCRVISAQRRIIHHLPAQSQSSALSVRRSKAPQKHSLLQQRCRPTSAETWLPPPSSSDTAAHRIDRRCICIAAINLRNLRAQCHAHTLVFAARLRRRSITPLRRCHPICTLRTRTGGPALQCASRKKPANEGPALCARRSCYYTPAQRQASAICWHKGAQAYMGLHYNALPPA